MNSNIQLWHGDCLELMKYIPDKSVDAIKNKQNNIFEYENWQDSTIQND